MDKLNITMQTVSVRTVDAFYFCISNHVFDINEIEMNRMTDVQWMLD